jgi:hypothetical protein
VDIPLVAVFPPAGFNSIYIVRPAELKFMVYIWLGALRVVLCERYSIVHNYDCFVDIALLVECIGRRALGTTRSLFTCMLLSIDPAF